MKEVHAGFIKTSTYPGKRGINTATVAFYNEFGTRRGTPERPFFRQAVRKFYHDIPPMIRSQLGHQKGGYAVNTQLAGRLGEHMQAGIQRRIRELRTPPNARRPSARRNPPTP